MPARPAEGMTAAQDVGFKPRRGDFPEAPLPSVLTDWPPGRNGATGRHVRLTGAPLLRSARVAAGVAGALPFAKGLPVLDSPVHAHAARVRALEDTLPPRIPAPALAATIHADRDAITVAPVGELDVATAPVLDGDLCAVRDLGFDAIVVDLRGLTFIDSTGVHLLVRWAASAAARGYAFRLIPGSDRIQRVFRLTGLLGSLGFERPRDAA